jgi:phosphoribosylformylglycinamidine synthase PurS subunit
VKAKIYITYKDGILDPQGKTVGSALNSMGLSKITDVAIGKFIEMEFDSKLSKEEAMKLVDESCRKLLANPNTEQYSFDIMDGE